MDVLLLTQDQCRLCDHAKQVLERLAAEYPLKVTTLELGSQWATRWLQVAD